MNKQNAQKEISRRDAVKVLAAAAGALALSTLPPQWSKPELGIGALPAHAQTSIGFALACGNHATFSITSSGRGSFVSETQIAPVQSDISMTYAITLNSAGGAIDSPAALTGAVLTDASGVASLNVDVSGFADGDTVEVTWGFENASDGIDSCAQIETAQALPPPFSIVSCGGPLLMCASADSTVTITPATPNVSMRYVLTPSNTTGAIIEPAQLSGTRLTDPSGVADLYVEINWMQFAIGDTFTIEWSFDDLADGFDSCIQVLTFSGIC